MRKKLKILSSPYECSRVLEDNEEIIIDDVPHTLLFKSIGCTEFARKTGGENPWTHSKSFSQSIREKLKEFPFLSAENNYGFLGTSTENHYGILDKECALQELEEYKKYKNIEIVSFEEYLTWIVKKTIRQELPLILEGFTMSSGRWQDLGRNITTMGEEMDLEDMYIQERIFQAKYKYLKHVQKHFGSLEAILIQFADIISFHDKQEVNFENLAQLLLDEVSSIINKFDTQSIYNKIKKKVPYNGIDFKKEILLNAFIDPRECLNIVNNTDDINKYRKKIIMATDPIKEEITYNLLKKL